jgi:light-regulated signal transduction histidine kinase (bacteriophytochrome)
MQLVYWNPTRKIGVRYVLKFLRHILMKKNAIARRAQLDNARSRAEVEASLRLHAEELARSNRDLEQFAYVSSHDLKEHLRMVGYYVELLGRHLDDKLDDKSRTYMRYIQDGSSLMQKMVGDLYCYAQVKKDFSPFQSIKSDDVVKDAIESLRPALQDALVTVRVPQPLPDVSGNYAQLLQLFQQVLANGIKFRRDDSPEVSIMAHEKSGKVTFSVKDNGIGMNPRYLERIFVIFQRLHSRQKYPGSGVGLSICKRIVEHHGGNIWVKSELGVGSTFFFSLPAAQADMEELVGEAKSGS